MVRNERNDCGDVTGTKAPEMKIRYAIASRLEPGSDGRRKRTVRRRIEQDGTG
jgi:hypothetical protein